MLVEKRQGQVDVVASRERELKHTLILAHSVSIQLAPTVLLPLVSSSRLHQSRLRSDNCDSSVITVPQVPQDQFLKHKCRKFRKCERGPQVLCKCRKCERGPQVLCKCRKCERGPQVPASAASAREVPKYRKCLECQRGSQVLQVPQVQQDSRRCHRERLRDGPYASGEESRAGGRCSTRERELKHTLILAHSVSISLVPQCPSTTSISSRLHQSRLRSDSCDSSVITVPQLPQDQFLKHNCRKFCKCEGGPQVLCKCRKCERGSQVLQVPQVRERVSSTASASSASEGLKYRKCLECERGSQVLHVPQVQQDSRRFHRERLVDDALTYKSGVDDPMRFKRSRTVGAHFGLTARRHQSGELDFDGHISRCGDAAVRTALYTAANALLTRSSKWSSLKAWGMKVAKARGHKKAVIAVARKLAVILHRMWIDDSQVRWGTEAARS